MKQHKPGCPALGGYGHGVEPCECGMKQPEALRLADALDRDPKGAKQRISSCLRRQQAAIQELRAALSEAALVLGVRGEYTAHGRASVALANTMEDAWSQWQPIETAPRDSVILLGYAPHPRMVGDRRVYEGRWHEEQQTWTSVNGFLVHTGATHWMPMPAPPEDA